MILSQSVKILSQSIITWSLTGGFDFSAKHHPADSEHFGIAVVEAMSYGCIPIFVNRGGLTEIVEKNTFSTTLFILCLTCLITNSFY